MHVWLQNSCLNFCIGCITYFNRQLINFNDTWPVYNVGQMMGINEKRNMTYSACIKKIWLLTEIVGSLRYWHSMVVICLASFQFDIWVISLLLFCLKFFRRPVSTPDFVSSDGSFFTPSSSYTTDDLRNGSASTHVSKATFKPSSSNDTLSYVTMPRGQEKRDVDAERWRNIEENNNNAFNSRKSLYILINNTTK